MAQDLKPTPDLKLPRKKEFLGPASLWKRGLAFVIDLALINLIILAPFSSLYARLIPAQSSFMEMYQSLLSGTGPAAQLQTLSAISTVFIMLYFVLLEWRLGQTVGKMILNLSVIPFSGESITSPPMPAKTASKSSKKKQAPENPQKITLVQSLLRNILFVPLFPFGLLWIAEPVSLLLSRTGQRLLERLSKTQTIQCYTFVP